MRTVKIATRPHDACPCKDKGIIFETFELLPLTNAEGSNSKLVVKSTSITCDKCRHDYSRNLKSKLAGNPDLRVMLEYELSLNYVTLKKSIIQQDMVSVDKFVGTNFPYANTIEAPTKISVPGKLKILELGAIVYIDPKTKINFDEKDFYPVQTLMKKDAEVYYVHKRCFN